eukprot:TRINITY_DN4791_c0_g1_i2.p1 TRINITY_DN4791_c0_g1~~TRINITY_DN4791_c0_g1_i2.p1  ORF type:complete len:508 (+),score=104.97 TRINITY_DN4791_c0_g1_i2:938-2461(+)
MAATAAMTMGSLAKFSNLELQHMFRFMEPESLLQVMCASNGLKDVVGKEDVWEVLCERSWGFTEPVGPDKATRTTSLPAAWALWARSFAGYDQAVVRRVFLWWRGMERWLETNAPEILTRLAPGASEKLIVECETKLGFALPAVLRAVYRFHNGQNLGTRSSMRERSVFEYAHEHEGLFGGYSFYTYYYCTTLLSVEEATFITARKPLALGERRFQFGANTLPMMNKALFAHDSAAGGEITLECPQFEESMRFVPLACPPGSLMAWLEEYLRRLQAGCYRRSMLWDQPDSDGVPALGISLFPRAPRNPDNASLSRLFSEAVTNGVRVRFSAVMCPQVAPAGQIVWAYRLGLRLLRRHPTNTRALECCQLTRRHWNITDDSVRETQQVDGEAVVGLYPILTGQPSTSQASAGGGDVSSAHIGTPHNSPDEDEDEFVYESCTSLFRQPTGRASGTMSGYFTLVPGTIRNPEGPPFQATVAELFMSTPEFFEPAKASTRTENNRADGYVH